MKDKRLTAQFYAHEKIGNKQFIYIKWFDSCFYDPTSYPEDIPEGIDIESVGIFVKEGKRFITIAQDRHPRDNTTRYNKSIPKINIIEKRWLK